MPTFRARIAIFLGITRRTPSAVTNYPLGVMSSRGGRIREAPSAGRRPAIRSIIAQQLADVKNYFEPNLKRSSRRRRRIVVAHGGTCPDVFDRERAGKIGPSPRPSPARGRKKSRGPRRPEVLRRRGTASRPLCANCRRTRKGRASPTPTLTTPYAW